MMFFVLLLFVLKYLLVLILGLIAVAYLTLMERKILAAMQRRKGPNIVGIFGLLQPLADGLKLLLKETVIPIKSNTIMFIIAPIITFMLSLLAWLPIPFSENFVLIDLDIGVLYVFAISSLNVYGIIISGWSSNSKYAFLGGLRSAAQMISYEVSLGIILMCVLLTVGSLNLWDIVIFQKSVWFCIPYLPMFLMFLISILAETNRSPFDLPEAEAELVSGYNVEYGSMGFALFFLGEYLNMIFMSGLTAVCFLGGSSFLFLDSVFIFGLKTLAILFFFVWVRATFPRYRYDQLMNLGWKVFLPLSLSFLVLISSLFFC